MRFCFVVLVAAVALFSSTTSTVAANTEAEPSAAVRALADQNDVDVNVERLLKIIEEDEDGDRAIGGSVLQKLKDAVMKIKFSSWYKAKMTPTDVNTMLIAQQGAKVDWAVATAYAAYFRNLKYGPYAIDMINKKKKKEEEEEENNA